MEKQVFLDRVRQTLLLNGLNESTVERQITRLSQYIDEEGGENADAMLDGEDPVLLAEEICTALRRNAARRSAEAPTAAEMPAAPIQPEPAPQPVAVAAQPREDAARTREIEIVHPSQTFDIVDLPETGRGSQPAADYRDYAPDYAVSPEADYPDAAPRRAGKKSRKVRTLEVDQMSSRAVEYADEKGGPLFWVLFILSLPFAAVIGLAVVALFIVAFAALAALMVLAIAALAAIAAVGTAFTLVALVYGIVQALSVLPIGLYEIGIGITAGASALFVSILLYNFAIRLLPFTMKQLARFFGWTVRSLKMLFIYVKGACAKL